MRQIQHGRASSWALQRLTTIGQACRAVLTETTRQTIEWVIARLQVDQWSGQRIMACSALG